MPVTGFFFKLIVQPQSVYLILRVSGPLSVNTIRYSFQLFKHFFLPLQHFADALDVLADVLYILHPLQPVFRREHHLRRRSRAAGKDRLFFLHDQNIIKAFLSRSRVSHIFKISGHIFLAVEIVGMKPHGSGPGRRQIDHFLGILDF